LQKIIKTHYQVVMVDKEFIMYERVKTLPPFPSEVFPGQIK
jgi:hypothetical protein